jgi:intergrase/recombinase
MSENWATQKSGKNRKSSPDHLSRLLLTFLMHRKVILRELLPHLRRAMQEKTTHYLKNVFLNIFSLTHTMTITTMHIKF